ncbi:hypothetical protein AQUCO_00500071v1 [Aquilegia coerulea]|uniref:Plant heme peroxidase family profile domain-containing protein n=1 Tax=Aquilegia coerulea TaxID=218851 RepID=A0A2G5EQ89_AQUCA|nr:hypothetical protein AQUCO_00500071v1 [Aquilegia coerulea]
MVSSKALCFFVLFSFSAIALQSAFADHEEDVGLVMNFYKDTCPQAEEIIREQVKLLYKRHKNTAFSWLRNIFHDCAVQSCDASLLLDSTRRELSEKETDRSFGLRNFRYLDTIKEAVERECPGVVSCADILVLSGRDGVVAVMNQPVHLIMIYTVSVGFSFIKLFLSHYLRSELHVVFVPNLEFLQFMSLFIKMM